MCVTSLASRRTCTGADRPLRRNWPSMTGSVWRAYQNASTAASTSSRPMAASERRIQRMRVSPGLVAAREDTSRDLARAAAAVANVAPQRRRSGCSRLAPEHHAAIDELEAHHGGAEVGERCAEGNFPVAGEHHL